VIVLPGSQGPALPKHKRGHRAPASN